MFSYIEFPRALGRSREYIVGVVQQMRMFKRRVLHSNTHCPCVLHERQNDKTVKYYMARNLMVCQKRSYTQGWKGICHIWTRGKRSSSSVSVVAEKGMSKPSLRPWDWCKLSDPVVET